MASSNTGPAERAGDSEPGQRKATVRSMSRDSSLVIRSQASCEYPNWSDT